jgi:hypothetical protein
MNPRSYRILIKPISTRVRCPVCHEEVYSRAGIHPQCAVRQSDPPRMKSKGQKFPTLGDPDPVSTAPDGADALIDSSGAATISTPLPN